jgi:AcrR family transcriptional regulator
LSNQGSEARAAQRPKEEGNIMATTNARGTPPISDKPAGNERKPVARDRQAKLARHSGAEPIVPFDRDRRFLDKQGAILMQAARLFSDRGFANVSLDDVAQRLDIAKPAIYYYFGSKEQILFECFSRAFDVADRVMKEALAMEGTAREKLESYMHGYLERHLNGEAPAMPLHDLKSLSAPFRARIERRRRARRNRLRALVTDAVAEGSFKPCDPAVVMSAWGGAASWIIESFDPRGGLSAQAVADQVVSLFLHGVLAER